MDEPGDIIEPSGDQSAEPVIEQEFHVEDFRPSWDGGRAILYFVLAAFSSLLMTISFIDPLGFNGSVIASEAIAFGLIPILLSRFFRTGWRGWISKPAGPAMMWPWAIVAVLAFVVAQSNLLVLLDRLYPIPTSQLDMFRKYLAPESASGLIGLILVAAVVPGVFEEIAFRGLIQGGLRWSYGPRHAVVWTGLLFALLHMNPWNFISLWSLGCFLGYVTERTRSLYPAVVLHLINNACALSLLYVQGREHWEKRPEFIPWYWTVLGGIVMLAAVWKFHRLTEPAAAGARQVERMQAEAQFPGGPPVQY